MQRGLLFSALTLTFSLLWGCGYHLPGRGANLPADVRTVHVEYFTNATFEPFLENFTTNAVIERFARSRAVDLFKVAEGADALLTGVVRSYSTTPISYDRNDRILEFRSAMTVEAALRRTANGEVLWKGSVTWTEDYLANVDKNIQEDNEAAAIRVISQRIADNIFYRISEDF
jgi:outer membrane lipopolysaccharide assembly protein LptE/RlpB